jgi:hypothetical protein
MKIRKNATRKYQLGDIFIEEDGPHEIVDIFTHPDSTAFAKECRHTLVYDYTLRPLTPEERVIWEIHRA